MFSLLQASVYSYVSTVPRSTLHDFPAHRVVLLTRSMLLSAQPSELEQAANLGLALEGQLWGSRDQIFICS